MSKLALLGGEKTVTRRLGKEWPVRSEEDVQLVAEVVRSGNWCRLRYSDPKDSKVSQFEDAFANYHDAKYGIAVTNGTQALECALKAAGVKMGDEVIVPAMTFVATATAVALVNAIPVIVDVDPETYNISPEAIEKAITPKTKAIIPVHVGGYPADMDRIMEIATKHNLVVIEDCAHAHGSQWRGKGCGSLGHMGCFSFQQGKTLTAGEGGMIITNDEKLAGALYTHHNIGRIAGRPFADVDFHTVASNLRMTELQAALLLSQFARFPEQVAVRERNIAYLSQGMADIPGVRPIKRDPRVTRWCFYFWDFHYEANKCEGLPKNVFIKAMQAEGVPVQHGAHGKPIYKYPVLSEPGAAIIHPCPEAERLFAEEAVSLPHALFLGGTEDMDLVLAAFKKVTENVGELLDWMKKQETV
ncbi:MAG TPA: DegT/DnrJ/EryC1/StrS family aminotransferase [Firmicutes bacterium]|nr:DegT/DnrJ/EryC1/StrS family aminotransferase [Bacillota bacterium]